MFFWTLLLTAILGWGSWGVVIFKLSPFSSSPEWSLGLFFISFFVALAATFSLIFYSFRRRNMTKMYAQELVNGSLRQGILVALLICLAALLQRLRVLTWWNAGLLFLIVVFAEFYWTGRKN